MPTLSSQSIPATACPAPWRVAVLALSRPLPAPSLAALEGFRLPPPFALQIDPSCHGTDWFAGDDAERALRFLRVWRDPAIDAIWVARGGYGHARLLDHLRAEDLAEGRDKVLIGYSDVTALMLYLYRRGRGRLFHAPMPIDLPRPELADDIIALFETLNGGQGEGLAQALTPLRPGRASGPLLAVNMTLLVNSIGTSWQPDLAGHILVLEDVDEAPYRLDRMFVHLRQAGLLRDLAALVLGEFTLPTTGAPFARSIAEMALAAVRCPVAGGMPVGHGPRNLPLEQGAPARLDLDGTLVWSGCPI